MIFDANAFCIFAKIRDNGGMSESERDIAPAPPPDSARRAGRTAANPLPANRAKIAPWTRRECPGDFFPTRPNPPGAFYPPKNPRI